MQLQCKSEQHFVHLRSGRKKTLETQCENGGSVETGEEVTAGVMCRQFTGKQTRSDFIDPKKQGYCIVLRILISKLWT